MTLDCEHGKCGTENCEKMQHLHAVECFYARSSERALKGGTLMPLLITPIPGHG